MMGNKRAKQRVRCTANEQFTENTLPKRSMNNEQYANELPRNSYLCNLYMQPHTNERCVVEVLVHIAKNSINENMAHCT